MRDTSRRMQAHHKTLLRKGGYICHLCGHGGADAIDHIIPLDKGGTDTDDNKAPAHHKAACPECGVKCNRVKSNKLIAPVIRRSGSLKR